MKLWLKLYLTPSPTSQNASYVVLLNLFSSVLASDASTLTAQPTYPIIAQTQSAHKCQDQLPYASPYPNVVHVLWSAICCSTIPTIWADHSASEP